MDYGLQMYSVRDITPKDMDGALRSVAQLGYKNVEFAGFFGISAGDIRAMLGKYGLRVSGTHTPWQEIAENFDQTLAYHKAIGNSRIIIPGADLSTREKLDAFIDMLRRFAPRLAENGMTLGYHNHSHEFKPNLDGQIIYDEIASRTDVALEIDTYWAYVAGKDPLELMDTFKARLPVIHIKDGDADGHGTPLGLGAAPVRAVYEKAVAMGIDIVVESETLSPDGLTEARICAEYLFSLEK